MHAQWNPLETRLEEFGAGVVVPERFDAWTEGPESDPYDVSMTVALKGARFVCKSLTVTMRDSGEPVTGEGLRLVPVGRLMREAVWTVLEEARGPDPFTVGPEDAADGPTDAAIRKVATVYQVAYALGEAPTARVAEVFSLTRATAGRWIRTARDRGYLGETTRGRKAV